MHLRARGPVSLVYMNTYTLTVVFPAGEQALTLAFYRLLSAAGFRPAGLTACGGIYTRVHSRHTYVFGVPHPAR